jgi:hypothetical protein
MLFADIKGSRELIEDFDRKEARALRRSLLNFVRAG